MLLADDVDTGMRAMGTLEIAQNWVFADRRGNIAYQMSGRMPVRREGWSGLIPLPGWEPANDWQGFANAMELPRTVNPESGFIVTANHDLNHFGVQKPINLPMGVDRAARIAELLSDRHRWSIDDVVQVQMDTYSLQAERFMAVLSPLLGEEPQADVLRRWDRKYDRDSYGASLFELFYKRLVADVFGRSLGDEVVAYLDRETSILAGFYSAFDAVLLDEQSGWFGHEGRDATFKRIAAEVLREPPVKSENSNSSSWVT